MKYGYKYNKILSLFSIFLILRGCGRNHTKQRSSALMHGDAVLGTDGAVLADISLPSAIAIMALVGGDACQQAGLYCKAGRSTYICKETL